MTWLQRGFVGMALGGTLLIGLTHCVVAPVAPVPSGYVVSPPVVIAPPYRPYRHYYPYRFYRPYRPYYGRYPYGRRW